MFLPITDAKLAAAFANLRKNAYLGPLIIELDGAPMTISIVDGRIGRPNSQTDSSAAPVYTVYINTPGDAALARTKWGVAVTTEENSIAHELGHVYFAFLLNHKKSPAALSAGRPMRRSDGSALSQSDWLDSQDETTARRFDLYSRPPGTMIPLLDAPKRDESLGGQLKEWVSSW